MIINFDKFNKARTPSLILCNSNGTKLFSMAMAKNRQLSIKLNGISELSFEIPRLKEDRVVPYYDYIIGRRYVEIEDIGRFVIKNVEIEKDGITEYKRVECLGCEFELASKNLGLLEGTYKFYDPSSADKSLMNIVLSYLPNWSIGEIEDDLWNIYRTFDIKDNNVYNFLMSEVQEAYQCIFIFDTFKRTISAKTVQSVIRSTDIFLSDRNLIKSLSINESTEDVKTALDIYGDGDLSIHSVNPMGTATLYDFTYYKNLPDMMSKDLVDAITLWENKLKGYKSTYANLLAQIKGINTEIIALNTQLTDLNSELKALQDEEAMKVAGNEDLADVNRRIQAKKQEIANKENEIKSKETQLTSKKSELKTISSDLKFEKNFTTEQFKELSLYIIQETHQCTNFAVTDIMTDVEKQEVMEELMKYGEEQLTRVSQPTYTFDIDVINFMRIAEFKHITDQFELGCEVTICIDREKDKYAKVMLLGYDVNLDNPEELELHFSSKLKFGNDKYTWEELINQSVSISTTVDFESPSWNKGEQANSKIDDYINKALDLTQQEIMSSDNQEFTLTRQGLRGREWIEATKSYAPEQLWMTKNVLVFSDNGFTGRPRMAIGKILAPDGSTVYGVNSEVLVGNITLTKKLIVENENHSFKVDGDTITIKNANIIITNDEGMDETLQDLLSKGGDASSLVGDILAGKNNIICSNSITGRVLALNENGIIVGTMGANGVITTEGTFITKDGINADYINSGTINAINITGSIITGSEIMAGDVNKFHTILNDKKPFGTYYGSNNVPAVEMYANSSTNTGWAYLKMYDESGNNVFSILGARRSELDETIMGYRSATTLTISAHNGYYKNELVCSGKKQAIVNTEHYGYRELYCEESARVYFTDSNISETYEHIDNNGNTYYSSSIAINPVFLETIELNSVCNYIVTVTPYSDARIWVHRVYDKYVIIHSDKPTTFSYEIKGIRKGYKDLYIQERSNVFREIALKQ